MQIFLVPAKAIAHRKITPSVDLRDPDIDEILRLVKRYAPLLQRMYLEVIVSVVGCQKCQVGIGQHCIGQYGKSHPGSMHAVRREQASIWKANNVEEWEARRLATFRDLVEKRKKGKV